MSPYCCLYTLYMAYIWPYMASGLMQNFENFPLPFRPRPTSAGSPDLLARGRGREWWGKFRRPTLEAGRGASFRPVKFTGRKGVGQTQFRMGAMRLKITIFKRGNSVCRVPFFLIMGAMHKAGVFSDGKIYRPKRRMSRIFCGGRLCRKWLFYLKKNGPTWRFFFLSILAAQGRRHFGR